MPIVNLNPHEIVTIDKEGNRKVYPPSSNPCRIKTEQKEVGVLNGIPVVKTIYGEIEGLPPAEDNNTYYIVNNLILGALNGSRPDCLAPDTGPAAIREKGQVVAVTRFTM